MLVSLLESQEKKQNQYSGMLNTLASIENWQTIQQNYNF